MVPRQDQEGDPVGRDLHQRASLLYVCRVVPVREHDSFRIGGSTGGVADVGDVVLLHRLPPLAELFLVLFEILLAQFTHFS